jgi:hypothetical protein
MGIEWFSSSTFLRKVIDQAKNITMITVKTVFSVLQISLQQRQKKGDPIKFGSN